MGSRKRSKPNPKAESDPVSEEAPLRQGPRLKTRDSLKPAVGESVTSDEPKGVESVQSPVNDANTVSVMDCYLVCNDVNFA